MMNDIIESAKYVYESIGPGHSEAIYQKGLKYKLSALGYNVQDEVEISVKMDNYYLGTFRLDLLVNNSIIIELKAINKSIFLSDDKEIIQLKKYLKHTNKETGILINFSNNDGCIFYSLPS
jgi:GxxExxY protein